MDAGEAACIKQLTYSQQAGLSVRTCHALYPAYLPVDVNERWYPVMTKLSGNLMVEIIQAVYPENLITLAASRDVSSDPPPRPRVSPDPPSSSRDPPLYDRDDDHTAEP